MKSPIVIGLYSDEPEEVVKFSDLKVLRSGAGWYVGTVYQPEDGPAEPGSRDSEYFNTEEEAKKFLSRLEAGDTEAIGQLRLTP